MNSRLFSNFIFHQLLITYSSIKNFYFAFSSPSDFQVGGAMRFFKNASKKVIQGRGKKRVRSWDGAPKKMRYHSLKKKMEVESKNRKIMRIDVLDLKWKISYLCVCSRTCWCNNVSECSKLCKRHHTHNSVLFVCFIFIWRSYYNKYFVRYLQVKSSLVLIIT